MKAIILAGGFGTRLKPLTLNTPKPIVPIFDRPFLYYQIDVLKCLPEISEVILSMNYQPERIQTAIGDGEEVGLPIRYLVEPSPRGTGGAVKFAESYLDDTTIVLNGDVLSQIDIAAVLRLHRERRAKATIVLVPVDNPVAYGLVEIDKEGNVRQFLEKPKPGEITCNTINAGVYILEPDTFDRIPPHTKYSIERTYFPSLIDRGETFLAYIHNGYWLDIGTPQSYIQAHRDIMRRRCDAWPFADRRVGEVVVEADADLDPQALIDGPCFIGSGAVIKAGARITPYTVIGRRSVIESDARVDATIVWPECVVGTGSTLQNAIIGHHCRIEDHTHLGSGVILGDGSIVTSHTTFVE